MESVKQKILNAIQKPIAWIIAAVSIILIYIKFLRSRNKDLEAGAETAESKQRDAVLKQQQDDLKTQHKDAIDALEKEKDRKLTDQELNDFLNKL